MVTLSDQDPCPRRSGLRTRNGPASVAPECHPVVTMGLLLTVVPLVLAFALLQRFRRSGPTAGAVK